MPDWTTVLQEHGPAVWKTAYRLLSNHADADDCFQETFADALRWTQRDKPAVQHWGAFLVRLATARAIDRLRERMRRSANERSTDALEQHANENPRSTPDAVAQEAEQTARLRKVIARLPPKQAEAFCLHCLEGWSYAEVAKSLSTSTDHVGVLISRARAALRDQIAAALAQEALRDLHGSGGRKLSIEGKALP